MEKIPSPEKDDLTPEEKQIFEGNSWRLPSDLEFVEKAENALEKRLLSIKDIDEGQLFRMLLGFREILINAIIHGNLKLESAKKDGIEPPLAPRAQKKREELLAAGEPEKYVTVEIDLTPSRLKIVIRDEGSGFRPEEVADPLAEENLTNPAGGGILLARESFNLVDYNKAGNEVTLMKILESPDRKTE